MDISIVAEKEKRIEIFFESEEDLSSFLGQMGPVLSITPTKGKSILRDKLVPSLTFYIERR